MSITAASAAVISAAIQATVSMGMGVAKGVSGRRSRQEGKELAEITRRDQRETDLMKQGQERQAQATTNRGLDMQQAENRMSENLNRFDAEVATDDVNKGIMDTVSKSPIKGLGESLARNVKSIERLRS